MNRTRVVIRREFLSTIRRKGYLIATLGMPAFIALYAGVVSIPAILSVRHARQETTFGIVNQCPALTLPDTLMASAEGSNGPAAGSPTNHMRAGTGLAIGVMRFRAYPDTAAARRALLGRQIAEYYVLPDSYLTTGAVEVYSLKDSPVKDRDVQRAAFERLLRRSVVSDRLSAEIMERSVTPVARLRRFEPNESGRFTAKTGAEQIANTVVPLIFGLLLLIAIFITSSMLISGVMEEKENRVMEVLLSSVSPWQLLFGKVVGLGGAGLLQLLVWVTLGFVVGVGVLPTALAALGPIHISPLLVLLCFVFFIAGYLQYGSLMVGMGSLGNNMRESQQLNMVLSMSAWFPFMMIGNILEEPNGSLARILSFIPLTAPVTMMWRIGLGSVHWWEIALSFASVVTGAYVALWVAAKLFRIGVLLYGKRPTLPEILRLVRA
jgi:ABC-2 type transport system permease protein